jgi:hypothetical protein
MTSKALGTGALAVPKQKQNCKSFTPSRRTGFCQDALCFAHTTRFTRMHVRIRNFTYAQKNNKTFPALIFIELTSAQQNFAKGSH